MVAIILCRLRSDQTAAQAELARRIASLALKDIATVLFSAGSADRATASEQYLAIAIETIAEAETLVATWRRESASLREIEIVSLRRNHDSLENLRNIVFI